MNFFKKVWITVTEFLPSRQITDEKNSLPIETILGKTEFEMIQFIDDKEIKTKYLATINRIEYEIKVLEKKKIQIKESLAKLSEIDNSIAFLDIDEPFNKIKLLIERETSLNNFYFFISAPQEIDNFLDNNLLLNQFREREVDRKRTEELHKKQIRAMLDNISMLISQNKFDEVKLLIDRIQKQIKSSYKRELERLRKEEQKLKEKELQILKRQQEEVQRKLEEKARLLGKAEEKRQEESRRLQEQEEREKRAKKEKERQVKAELENLLVKKQNWQEFQQILQQNGIKTFYHFTDRANVKSIKDHGGLYSWDYCGKHGIDIPYPGGDIQSRQLDIKYKLQDFVRLSFCNDHPMMYRLKQDGRNLVLLTVKPDVAYLANTVFSDINATDSDHSHGKNIEDLKRVNFRATKRNYVRKDDDDFKKHQAEIIVKTWIPIEYIININDF